MRSQIQHFVQTLFGNHSNRWLDNMDDAEVRQSTIQFLSILIMLGLVMIIMQSFGRDAFLYSNLLLNLSWAGFYIAGVAAVYLINMNKHWCVRLSLAIVFLEGLIAIIRWIIYKEPSPGDLTVIGVMLGLILGAFLLPWTPKQTIMLSALWVFGSLSSLLVTKHSDDFSIPAAIFVYIVITFPGVMISFFKLSRFQDQLDLHFLKTQYEDVRSEIQAAKNIHERAFPKPKSSGNIRFTYSYRPMSQIGGDSIFAATHRPGDPDSPVTIVLFDVTGHGLSAALTANRLQGELVRLIGEIPGIDPGSLLTNLDRYVSLTLADTAVLVSAVALTADPLTNEILIANAGHPPAIHRSSRGFTSKITSSCPVLGVGVQSELNPNVEKIPFQSGDSMILYTDGVSEAVDTNGDQYSDQGVIDLLEDDWNEQSLMWPEKILNDVEKRRAGNASDDILIVEIYRA